MVQQKDSAVNGQTDWHSSPPQTVGTQPAIVVAVVCARPEGWAACPLPGCVGGAPGGRSALAVCGDARRDPHIDTSAWVFRVSWFPNYIII